MLIMPVVIKQLNTYAFGFFTLTSLYKNGFDSIIDFVFKLVRPLFVSFSSRQQPRVRTQRIAECAGVSESGDCKDDRQEPGRGQWKSPWRQASAAV